MIKKMAFVGVPVRDVEASKRFWGDLLGIPLARSYHGRWYEYDTPEGKSIALDTYSPQMEEAPTPYLALETDDIVAEVRRLREGGVRVVKDVWENKDPDGRVVCKMAVVLDPEGHAHMLHEIAPDRA